jgi:hypothetical protein
MQKFHNGDHVMIAEDLGSDMSHFQSGCEAIVVSSYADEYGGNDSGSYTVDIKGYGRTAWYCEHQLTLIRSGAHDLLAQWREEMNEFIAMQSNLDWIFSNGNDVLVSASAATCEALFACLTDSNMWGSSGEGFAWRKNALAALRMASPYLLNGKKQDWLEYCAKYRKSELAG